MPDSSPNCHRCSRCDLNWPHLQRYQATCAACGGETWEANVPDVLSYSDANRLAEKHEQSRKRHAEFEAFYADREAKRQVEIQQLEALL